MKKIHFKIEINAKPQKVWQVLWDNITYKKWAGVFMEGSYAVTDWKQGSKVQFLSPDGGGLYSLITECRRNEYMAFKHIGEMKNFEELPVVKGAESWSGSMETYTLKEHNGVVLLECSLDATEEMENYFTDLFPKAMEVVKNLSETPLMITIEATINAPVEKTWKYFTLPEHIVNWNAASDDWHTIKAENDLRERGKFSSRMEAKDKSFGFDFGGTYTRVDFNQAISYTLDDTRKVDIKFDSNGASTKITESFESETQNSLELQQTGWQMILNNFKKYTEAN